MKDKSPDALGRLLDLVRSELTMARPIKQFVQEYERVFNLELDQSSVPPEVLLPLRELFEVVVWFSPYPKDIAAYPGYRSEAQVREATKAAAEKLTAVSASSDPDAAKRRGG